MLALAGVGAGQRGAGDASPTACSPTGCRCRPGWSASSSTSAATAARAETERGADVSDRITYVGHATVLLELGGSRLLTDPLLRPRLLGVIERRPAERRRDAVTEGLDAVLISHLHHDHLDFRSLKRLDREHCRCSSRRERRGRCAGAGSAKAIELAAGRERPPSARRR